MTDTANLHRRRRFRRCRDGGRAIHFGFWRSTLTRRGAGFGPRLTPDDMMPIADASRLHMDANPDSMFSVAKLVDRIMKEPNWADESDKFCAPEQPSGGSLTLARIDVSHVEGERLRVAAGAGHEFKKLY